MAVVAVCIGAGSAFALFGSDSSTLSDPVAQAATVSAAAAGYRIHMQITIPSPAAGAPITGVGDGFVDARDHAATITVAMSFGDSPQVAQVLGSSTLRMTELIDGTTVYMKLPAVTTGALGAPGKEWLKIDLAKSLHLPGLASLEGNPATGNPSEMLQYLRAVSDSVVAEGHQRIGGLETVHYHANISLDRVISALPPADRAAAQQAISGLEQIAQLHAIPVDVWVDSGHLIRRMRMTFGAVTATGQSTGFGLTMDFSDYGPQPRPSPPPADQVQDIGALAGSLSGQL
jgi:hypothetical protein